MPPVIVAVAAGAASIGATAGLSGAIILGITINATFAGIVGAVAGVAVSFIGPPVGGMAHQSNRGGSPP